MCFVYAYADCKGVSVNLFRTRQERDTAVRDLLSADFEEPPFPPTATAEAAWAAAEEYLVAPDFELAFGEL